MWLRTQHGFDSIVQKKPGEFHIRGRLKGDMERLIALCGCDWKLIRTTDADYRYRIVCGLEDVQVALAALAKALDYSNFKSRIHSLPDQDPKSEAYSDLWQSLYRLQE